MNPYVDLPIFFILSLLFYIGWLKGFWRTILGPIALAIGMILSYIYYFETGNFLMSIVVSIVAPFVIKFLFDYVLSLFPTRQKEQKITLFFFWNHFFGGIFHTAWHGAIIYLILLAVVILPENIPGLKTAQGQIRNSLTYTHLFSWTKNFLPGGEKTADVNSLANALSNPENIKRMQDSKEYTELMDDNRIKRIVEDEDLLKKIQEQKIFEVVNSEKIWKILQDGELIKKILKLNERIISEAKENWQAAPKSVFNH